MSSTNEVAIIGLVLLSSALHAAWHSFIKISNNRFITYSIVNVFAALSVIPFLVLNPRIAEESIPWLVASIALHLIYKVVLILAYRHHDFSVVFPISRGTAPIFIVAFLFLFGEKSLPSAALFLILALGVVISSLAFFSGAQRDRSSAKPFLYAVLSAVITASYTVIDGLGAKASEAPLTFIFWMYLFDGLVFPATAAITYKKTIVEEIRKHWKNGFLAGAFSVASYAIIVYAMTKLDIAIVAAIREINIVFALLIAIFILRENVPARRIIMAIAISVIVAALSYVRISK